MQRTTRTLFAAGLLTAIQAGATPVTLTIDPSRSSIDIDATFITTVADETDSASTPIGGFIKIDLDRFENPTSIAILDFELTFENDVVLDFDFGLAGSATATLGTAAAVYGLDGKFTGPVLVGGGAFDFPAVPAGLTGTLDASYELLLLGSNSAMVDLADFGLFESPIGGVVTGDGVNVSLNATALFETLQELVPEIASLHLSGAATIVATGKNPGDIGCNAADVVRPFGVIDLSDINTFINAFNTEEPLADLAPEFGVFDLNDIQAFVNAFNAGCP